MMLTARISHSRTIEESVFSVAKRQSLSGFLEGALGVHGKMVGSTVRFSACPSCGVGSNSSVKVKIVDDSYFSCFRCGAHGSIIDAACAIWSIGPLDAAKQLVGTPSQDWQPRRKLEKPLVEETTKQRALKECLLILNQVCPQRDNDKALEYLCDERALPKELVQEAKHRRLLGTLPAQPEVAKQFLEQHIGRVLCEKAGLWKPDKEFPAIAFRPLIFFMPGLSSAEFRLARDPGVDECKSIRYGTLQYPWFWKGTDVRGTMLVEGFIDLLSAVALGYAGHVLGLPGCSNWRPKWLVDFAKANNDLVFDIALDNDNESPDNPGQMWADKMEKVCQDNGLRYRRCVPPNGDLNNLLKSRQIAQ